MPAQAAVAVALHAAVRAATVVAPAPVAEVGAVAVPKADQPTLVAITLTTTLTMAAVAAMPSRAAICQRPSKPCAGQVSARRVVMVVAMAAATVAR